MTRSSVAVPLRPDFSAVRARRADAVFRTAAAACRAAASSSWTSIDEAAEALGYSVGDLLITRAATSPTTLASFGLSTMGVADWSVLAPGSAFTGLLEQSLKLSLDGRAVVAVPAYLTSAADAGAWVAESAPIPVRGVALLDGGVLLTPKKLAVITPITRELAEHSAIENLMRSILGRAIALAVDAAIFSSSAASSTTPAGILNGVSDSGASAATGQQALIEDVATLVEALAAKGGGISPVFITDPASAVRFRLWAPARFDAPILASSAVTAKTLIAVEAAAFVSAFAVEPEISASIESTIHSDTSPSQIGSSGTLASGSTLSLFQSDLIALRAIFRGSFGMRGALVTKVDGVNW